MFPRRILAAAARRFNFLLFASLALFAPAALSQYATRMMPQDGRQPLLDNYNASSNVNVTGDPQADVQAQMRLPGARMLVTTPTKGDAFDGFYRYLEVAKLQQPGGFRWAYVYDEMFWEGNAVRIGAYESDIVAAARRAQAYGMKSTISMLPDVILDRNFRLSAPDAFDVIGIDVYQGVENRVAPPASCQVMNNVYANLLWCSLQRLRQAGFKGEVWYIFQGFIDPRKGDATQFFALQNQVIALAGAHGISGVVNYGYAFDFPQEEPLARGKGSAYDALLRVPVP
jgi:hypothetical protein